MYRPKILLLTICLLWMVSSCKKNEKIPSGENDRTENVDNKIFFDHLVGVWMRTNEKEGRSTVEYWGKIKDSLYEGMSYTMQKRDTVFKEKMRIEYNADNWDLIVSGVNENPTPFKIITLEKGGFTANNPENEFPKNITYSLKEGMLMAEISAGDTKVPFVFKRLR